MGNVFMLLNLSLVSPEETASVEGGLWNLRLMWA